MEINLATIHRLIDAVYNDTAHEPQLLLIGFETAAELGVLTAQKGLQLFDIDTVIDPTRARFAQAIPQTRCVGCNTMRPNLYVVA